MGTNSASNWTPANNKVSLNLIMNLKITTNFTFKTRHSSLNYNISKHA